MPVLTSEVDSVSHDQAATGSAVSVAAALWAVPLLAIVVLFLVTPTLNLDDLSYALNTPSFLHDRGFWRGLLMVLTNSDLGVAELRTYGLARAIQILTALAAGKSAVAVYAFLAVLHACGSLLVFRITQDLIGDTVAAAFAAVAWFASPAALPFLKVEHHYLYLIAAYYPLLAWIWLAARGQATPMLGGTLLTATWLLGEGPIIPMGAAVLAVAWIRREGILLTQGLIAAALLFTYVAYQFVYVRDTHYPQRFRPTWITDDGVQALTRFGKELWQDGRGILGLRYRDVELAHDVVGTGILKGPLVVGVGAVLIASVWFLCRKERPRMVVDHRPALVMAGVAALSLAIYALLALFQNGTLTMRYSASFFVLAPLGLVCGLSAFVPARFVRLTAGVLAAISVAFSVGLLLRAEVLVNRPNRELLAQLRPGTAIVLAHAGWPKAADGKIDNGYPGLVPIYQTGLANPFRSAWTTQLALRLYGNVALGTACRRLDNGDFAISYNGGDETVFQEGAIMAVDIPDQERMMSVILRPVRVCPARPAAPTQGDDDDNS